MEKKLRYVWWVILGLLLVAAGKKWVLTPPEAVGELSSPSKEIVVYVTGAVAKPGLYTLPSDARLDHALREAEVLPEANIDVLNLAEKLKDGQKITIPYRVDPAIAQEGNPQMGAAAGFQPQASIQGQLQSQASLHSQAQQGYSQAGAPIPTATPAPAMSAIDAFGRVNINLAGVEELDQLPGIGPVIAQRIVDYRNEHGYFLSPEDIQKVSGIGPKTYEKLASKITVGP